jgi:hypothetical protein
MIEFSRYTRLKPQGLVSVTSDGDGLFVDFARFDNENGKRLLEPERCRVSFAELAEKAAELESQLIVVRELLALK